MQPEVLAIVCVSSLGWCPVARWCKLSTQRSARTQGKAKEAQRQAHEAARQAHVAVRLMAAAGSQSQAVRSHSSFAPADEFSCITLPCPDPTLGFSWHNAA